MLTSFTRVLQAALCSALLLASAQACGPDFFPDTFVRTDRPDFPKRFVQGRLGLLQPGFARADLFVAYRYLNGGTLDASEQKAWAPTYSFAVQAYGEQEMASLPAQTSSSAPETPLARWVRARAAFPGAPLRPIHQESQVKIHTSDGYEFENSYLNCPDDAFRTASATLADRSRQWGSDSAPLLDWLHAQDQVFSNCSGPAATPPAAPTGSPVLLIQDRAYQTAAAHLYGRAFPEAAKEFMAISADRASPWQQGSGYVAARALVRQAYFARLDANTHADFDPAIMQAAAEQLHSYLQGNPPPQWRRAAESLLALVRLRIDPYQRARELASLLSGPGHDPDYAQDLQDLLWVTSTETPPGLRAMPNPWASVPAFSAPGGSRPATPQEQEAAALQVRQAAYEGSAKIRATAPLLDWALTFQSLAASAPGHALEAWRTTQSLPWLLAALVLAPDNAAPPDDLLRAASLIPVDSPTWQTATYHRARLLIAAGRVPEARALLADFAAKLQQQPASEREPSTLNALRGLEMLNSPSLSGFLSFLPRTLLLASSQEQSSVDQCQDVIKNPARHYNCVASVDPEQLDVDGAATLNRQAPLSLWLAAAQAPDLPPQLRSAIAMQGWTRSVLLDDKTNEAAFLHLLPPALREQAATASPMAKWMTLARNPGLRPYLDAGVQRAYSYDFVESYRDNWCYRPEPYPAPSPPAAFLTPEQKQQGENDARRLAPIRSVFVGQQILRAVQSDARDPQAAEALYLVLRMIRYGCSAPAPSSPEVSYGPPTQEARDLLQLKRDASRLLRQRYAASPWTKNAAPFAG